MTQQPDQRVAVVTGGGSGIGLAIAKRFAEQKIRTVIIGRTAEKLEQACRQMEEGCQSIAADLTQLNDIPALVDRIEKEFGSIDILVNNAGVNHKEDFTEVSDDEFKNVLLTNVTAVFSISREVVKKMIPRNRGCIINISSMASQYGLPKVIAYTASKAAIEGMTRAMAVELSPVGIRVNCIAPGFISTDMSARALNDDPDRLRRVLDRTPMGKLGEPGDIADAALFLASDAAAFITGTVLPVDGGNAIGF